jgi:hypothetical protein
VNFLDRILIQSARRGARDSNSSRRWTALAFGLAVLTVIGLGVVFLGPQVLKEHASVARRSELKLDAVNDWHVDYADRYSTTSGTMLNDALYLAPNVRDAGHARRVQEVVGQTFWLGAQVASSLSQAAAERGADYFCIGYLYGTYEVFLDNQLVLSGDHSGARDLVGLSVPHEKLASGFKIAIRIKHDMHDSFPDTLYFTGLLKPSDFLVVKRQAEFEWLTSTAWSGGFNFALGVLFFAFWLCAPRKQELAAFAAFGFIHAITQVSLSPIVWSNMDGQTWHRFNFVVTCYESVVIFAVGAAVSRLRHRALFGLMFLVLAAPWFIFLTDLRSTDLFTLPITLSRYLNPLAYLAAGLLCLSQARLLSLGTRGDLSDPGRVLKLHFCWLSMLAMCVIQLFGSHLNIDVRIYNAVFLVVFASMVVHDFRRAELLVRRAPLSRYHQRAQLPPSISCAMVSIDLKRSEQLFHFEIERRTGSHFVQDTIAAFCAIVHEASGEVIQTEGDSVLFFLELAAGHDALVQAIAIVHKLKATLNDRLSEAATKYGPEFPSEIGLRAAIGLGEVRPIMQRLNGREIPAWAQAGNSNVLVEVARLLEAETKVARPGESLLVMSATGSLEPASQSGFAAASRSATVEIKHGRAIHVRVTTLDSRAAA